MVIRSSIHDQRKKVSPRNICAQGFVARSTIIAIVCMKLRTPPDHFTGKRCVQAGSFSRDLNDRIMREMTA